LVKDCDSVAEFIAGQVWSSFLEKVSSHLHW